MLHIHADAGGLTQQQHRESLELFQSDIAPTLRRDIPDPPWGWGSPAQSATLEDVSTESVSHALATG